MKVAVAAHPSRLKTRTELWTSWGQIIQMIGKRSKPNTNRVKCAQFTFQCYISSRSHLTNSLCIFSEWFHLYWKFSKYSYSYLRVWWWPKKLGCFFIFHSCAEFMRYKVKVPKELRCNKTRLSREMFGNETTATGAKKKKKNLICCFYSKNSPELINDQINCLINSQVKVMHEEFSK